MQLGVSPPTRQLLVGKQRHAPPARMMLPESFFATLAASCCPEWRHIVTPRGGIECIQHTSARGRSPVRIQAMVANIDFPICT
jgi:hypothetical protein